MHNPTRSYWRYLVLLVMLMPACTERSQTPAQRRLQAAGVYFQHEVDGRLVATIPFNDGNGGGWEDSDIHNAANDLQQLTNLDAIILDLTQISDDAIADISRIKSLRTVKLRITSITDKGITGLSGLSNLNTLELDGSRNIRGSGISALAALPVVHLSLRATSTTDEVAPAIGALKNLEKLDVGMTGIGNKTLSSAARLPQIRILHADDTRITDAGILFLATASQLEEIGLSTNPQLSAPAIRAICRLPSLRKLDLLGSSISQEEMSKIQMEFPTVRIWYSPAPSR